MSREIKFRIWSKEEKKFLDQNECHSFNISPVDGHVLFLDGHDCVDVLVPLQYTGLKDKNGIEIYEGDIVTIDISQISNVKTISKYEIVWNEDTTLKYGWGAEVWLGSLEHRHRWILPLDGFGIYEVVGNIYENLELLT